MTRKAAEARLAWLLVLPAAGVIALIALVPLVGTVWESLHLHDLRMPWLERPFVGLANYAEALGDARFRSAMVHTAFFTAVTVTAELALGLLLALLLNRSFRGRGLLRTFALLPWAIPTVIVALVWRFMFEAESGIVNALLLGARVIDAPVAWLVHEAGAWLPVLLADIWKTTPFVALLLLAGLQNIDATLYEAARMDGAPNWRQFIEITLPLLRPTLLVALIFRTLDAFRVFDLIYVLTGGGPGSATEPISLYAFSALLQNLRFGYGSALSVIVFAVTFGLALLYIRLLGRSLIEGER
jgi:ABC-type sugar transport system permease subunit